METRKVDFLNDRRFLGHPLGLGVNAILQLTNAFANYGMTSILIYYLYTAVSEGGLGFTQIQASQFVNIYNSLNFMCGIVGAYLADRFLGIRKACSIGYGIRTLGYIFLAIPGGGVPFYLGSQCVLLGASLAMGTSLNALSGKIYSKEDTRRDGGFTIIYVLNNVGAIAPVITGTIALIFNYHVGFLLAAVVMGLGWLLFVLTQDRLFGDTGKYPDDPFPADKKMMALAKCLGAVILVFAIIASLLFTGVIEPTDFCNAVSAVSIFLPLAYLIYIYSSKKTTRAEARRLIPFTVIFIANCFGLMVWMQSTTIMAVYAAERVNMNFLGFELTPAAFQTVPAIFAVIFGILSSALWNKMGERQPSTILKFGLGTVFWGLGPLLMVIPFVLYPSADIKVSPLWLIIFYGLIIWGEALTSPIGSSAATKVAPAAFAAQMVTIWQLSSSTGAGLSSLAANFYREGNEIAYFLGIGIVTILVGLFIWVAHKKLSNMMEC